MNILYFTWYENSKDDMEYALLALGLNYKTIAYEIKNYDNDPELESFVISELKNDKYDILYSFNYIPVLSKLAQRSGIKYISWVYDCPHYTLYSGTISNSCNYVFLFDHNMVETVKDLGAKHVFHMPLAVNTERLNRQLENVNEQYNYDVSFVGSLYKKSPFDMLKVLDDKTLGYIDAVMNIQHLLYGTNIVYNMVTSDKVQVLDNILNLDLGSSYYTDKSIIWGDIINKKITSNDRITAMNALAAKYPVHIFTGSDTQALTNVKVHGTISYINEMPLIFRTSKINLNVTLRSITSGIPLRALDIMGAGGFLLSNYQPELDQYFINGTDMVMYEDDNDLIQKTGYYLAHDEERKTIAANGLKKVTDLFNYTSVVSQIFKSVN